MAGRARRRSDRSAQNRPGLADRTDDIFTDADDRPCETTAPEARGGLPPAHAQPTQDGRVRPGLVGYIRSLMRQYTRRVALDEVRLRCKEAQRLYEEHKHAADTALVMAVLLLVMGALLVEDFEIGATRMLGYFAMGFAAGAGGVGGGILSVRQVRVAEAEALETGRRKCLPLHLRRVVRVIYASALVGGLLAALSSGGLSLLLVEVFARAGDAQVRHAFKAAVFNLVLAWNVLVFLAFALRNHLKTRGSGGWTDAEKVWKRDGTQRRDWTAFRALL